MKTTGKKNAAGGWLLGEAIWRVTSATMLSMAVVGFALGFMVRGLPLFDGLAGDGASWALLGAMVLVLGGLYAYWLRVDATWVRGMMAERQVGDLIDHAVAPRGCAFAHDVKEALGGRGNVDHVVMTPALSGTQGNADSTSAAAGGIGTMRAPVLLSKSRKSDLTHCKTLISHICVIKTHADVIN